MRAFRILSKIQKISIRLEVMAKILADLWSQFWDLQGRQNLKGSNSAITSERIEIFWILDKILKALIETDRMVPLLRVYDLNFNFRFLTKKKRTEKNIPYVRFFPSEFCVDNYPALGPAWSQKSATIFFLIWMMGHSRPTHHENMFNTKTTNFEKDTNA